MLARKIGWSLWALLPVAGISYHFGPGQLAYTEDRARDVLSQARSLDLKAQDAQDEAYRLHLETFKARRAAAETRADADAALAKEAAAREDQAYANAAGAWKTCADKLQEAQDMLVAGGSAKANPVRVARDRALIRAGRIAEGVGDLEGLLDALDEAGQQETSLAREAREEAATGYYYGARLMRLAGKPTNEWREVSGWSRQNFRYLAEHAGSQGEAQRSAELQKNLELVLNLEQSGQEDLLARPIPKNSPKGSCENLGTCKNKGKTKRPPRKGQDARGASGVGDIDSGW